MADFADFADFEPEDAWDRDDPVPVLVDNLLLRLALLALIGDVLTDRDRLRITDLADDLAYVRSRVDDG